VYHRVMIRGKFRDHERSVEVARGAACHYNTWTKKRKTLKNLSRVEYVYSNYKTVFLDLFLLSCSWSFGILLWEMATMGGVPYPTLTNRELCRLLKTGYRMERPDMCCDDVYELMSECRNEDPSSRPSFSELIDRLEVIMTRDVPYCDLDKHDESRSYYNLPVNADEHSG